jgi:hypothetical protein
MSYLDKRPFERIFAWGYIQSIRLGGKAKPNSGVRAIF